MSIRDMFHKLLVGMAVASLVWSTSHLAGCGRVQPKDVQMVVDIIRAACDITDTVSECERKISNGQGGQGGK
jgi:hypothetical protein